MKKITTSIIKYNNNGEQAVTFKRSIDELPSYIKSIVDLEKGYTDQYGVHHWITGNCHVMADYEALIKADGTSITFGVVIFTTPIEEDLKKMGIVVVPNLVDVKRLCNQLMDTYTAMGITDWLKDGIPSGIRSIVAFRYGYMLNAKFNAEIDAAMKMADDILREKQGMV